jgi:hypothetical protein
MGVEGPGIGAPLEFGDRLIDSAGVAADDPSMNAAGSSRSSVSGSNSGCCHIASRASKPAWVTPSSAIAPGIGTPSRIMSLDVAVNLELAVTVSVIQPVRAAVDTAVRNAMP